MLGIIGLGNRYCLYTMREGALRRVRESVEFENFWN
jgi:hypothetical protein